MKPRARVYRVAWGPHPLEFPSASRLVPPWRFEVTRPDGKVVKGTRPTWARALRAACEELELASGAGRKWT